MEVANFCLSLLGMKSATRNILFLLSVLIPFQRNSWWFSSYTTPISSSIALFSSGHSFVIMRKQLDPRIPAIITNGVKANHRSFFVMVGDKGRDQVRLAQRGLYKAHGLPRSSTFISCCPKPGCRPVQVFCGATRKSWVSRRRCLDCLLCATHSLTSNWC